jgi:hypothetical protein
MTLIESKLLYIFEGVELYPITVLTKPELFLEYTIDELMDEGGKDRMERARRHVRTQPPKVIKTSDDGFETLEFNFKSFPSTSGKRAQGYVEHKGREIREMYCSCEDFFYRIWYKAVDMGIAKWDIDKKYPRIKQPNQMAGNIKPSDQLFVCKHIAALDKYL